MERWFLQRHFSHRVGLFSSFKKTDPAGRVRPSEAESLRRADLTAVPAGAGWHVVAARGSSETSLWPSFAFDFLSECTQFRPLQEHLHKYARYHALEPSQVREIGHWAEQMLDAGLLLTVGRLVERCAAAGSGPGEPARIEAIGIPTAGHEERLRRVITTFARNARDHGRRVEMAVSSNGPAERAGATAALVASLAREESVKIELLDHAGRAAYGAKLSKRAGVDPAIADFAMSDPLGAGFACGANRNALLLRHAGRAYLSLDDDMICEMAGAPGLGRSEGLAVFSSRDAFERWFYPEYGQAFEGVKPVTGDYLALHERMLGLSVNAFVAREAEPDFIGISDDLLRRLQETDGRIVATFTGHYGHPGVPTSYYYLTYHGETLARLTGQGEEQYRAFMASGGVRALVPRMAIADASLSPGMAIGIDARRLIPPFPPVMHAEDFVWGAAVWQCCAAGFAGHLPVAARHDPGLGRGILAPPLTGEPPVAVWEFAHILRGIITAWSPPSGMSETEVRLDTLGRHLCDIAGAPALDFGEYLRSFVLQHESEKIAFMETCLEEESEAPGFWRKDVEDYIEQTRMALAGPDFDIPFEMRGKWPPPEARTLIQRMVYEYGRLLRAWPALVRAARELAE